jgi:hypothetical protein
MKTKDSLKLESGFEIQIRAIQIVETYKEEFILGEPDEYDNIRVYNGINCPKNWRLNQCVLYKHDFNLKQSKFSPYTVAVWLRSNESVNDPIGEFDFSEVALIFTIDSIIDFNVQKQLQMKLRNFNWQSYAMNGQY